jgi:glycosyltransferase involved in cell wall biosynthesis
MVPAIPNIAIVCLSHSLGGLELTAFRLAEEFRQHGGEVLLLVPLNSPLLMPAMDAGIASSPVKRRWRYFDPVASKDLARAFRNHQIQYAIVLQSKDVHLAVHAQLFARKTKLIFYQQMQSGINKRDVYHTWLFSRLSAWATLTDIMRSEVLHFTKMSPEKVTVIPLGIDVSRFNPDSYSQKESRKKLGLPENRIIVGTMGRLDPGKGQDLLLKAIPLVLAQVPEAFFVIAGEETRGEEGFQEKLTMLQKDLMLERDVRFMPFTNDVPLFMSALDLFVLPTLSETYGLVLLEAAAMKKPVIGTNSGGVPELIQHEKTGLIAISENYPDLARAIVQMLSNPVLCREYGEAGRKRVIEQYQWKATAGRLIDLFVHRS